MQQETYAGVLSQTLTSSPCMRQVLSARIRTPHHNDVVMVGHSSIHLREFMPSMDLSNVIAQLDLGTQILSAKVISAESRVEHLDDPALEEGREETLFFIKDKPWDDTQPPQLVVLSTASSDLVFVYAKILPNGSSQFVHARRHVLGGRHWPRKYGKHLAIDSESRAMAIASMKGSFGLLRLKNVEEIKDSIDHWDPRDPSSILPITEQIFVQVDGVILRMDFLQSSRTNRQQVVLLLIVANQGVSRLLLYKWDQWQTLTTTKPLRCSGYALPTEDAFPHLLIPSRKALSFAIVTGHKLVFYDDITTKKKTKLVFNIPTPEDQKDKQWVQWAKAARHRLHEESKEDIFLIREDGLLKTTSVTHNSKDRSHITFEPGHLHIHVDTAVCALSAPPLVGGDILIACGDTTEGGVFHLEATKNPVNRQSLANWSPITDMVLLPERSNTSIPGKHTRILAAAGIHENRAFLTEIRYGIEAQIAQDIDCEDAATVDRLWILHQPSQKRDLFLTSHHEYTTIICYEDWEEGPIARGPETFPQLSFEFPTLAACNIDHDSIIQITTNQIHILDQSEYSHIDPESLRGNFVCADVNSDTGKFVVANRNEQNIQLIGGVVCVRPDNSIDVLPLPPLKLIEYLPISLTIANLASREIFVAGSQDGCLHLYDLTNSGITENGRWELSSFHQGLDDPKISSITILSLPNARDGLLVCGLKTGQVMVLEMTMQNSDAPESISLSLSRFQTIGSTAVSISVETGTSDSHERSAYMTCGAALFQIHLYRNGSGLDFTIDCLLITAIHHNKKHLQKSTFNAVAPIERVSSTAHGHMCGLLASITQNDILILRTGRGTLIPERICHIKPTHHLVHSERLDRTVASVAGRKASSSGEIKQNLEARPSLQILDSAMPDTDGGSLNAASHIYFGEAGEKVRAVLRFSPTNGGDTHHEMIVVGSECRGDGRLSYITAKRLSQEKPGALVKTFITYANKPISAMCEYGLSSLLVCAGRELKLVHLDFSTKPPHWEHQAEIELPSRATELRTKGSVVYVATSLHSYILIREQDKKFQVIGSDNWAGRARNVLPYGSGSTLVNLISDEGSRILNFADRPVRGNKPTFEATVPEAIDKIINIKSTTGDGTHERFLGATIDGTVYMFTTLNEREMRLLAFLEQLCQPIRDQAARSASILAHRIVHQYANKLESAGITTPSLNCTHARGDVLKGLLMPGPYHIYFLLRQRVKEENGSHVKAEDELESLRDVARPVLGQTNDLIEAVILWLRRILNVPSL